MPNRNIRILIYSHDSFGLGHLRRCRAIAHSLAEHRDDVSILIISGSPLAGSFEFHPRVDFVRIPGVVKQGQDNYAALNLAMEIEDLLDLRSSLIRQVAESFSPDIFLVDKEPLGLRGEVLETLRYLKSMGTELVLGLRDVMDDPETLASEWKRKQSLPALEELYDQVWVYGLEKIYDPLAGIDVPKSVMDKRRFTGYVRRHLETQKHTNIVPDIAANQPYLLTLTGGGGDGAALVDWVLRAYEYDRSIPTSMLLVLGPFMNLAQRSAFLERADRLPDVEAIVFDAHIEALISDASGVVAMGGYNTFCEILSFDRPSLIIPRTEPRLEQFIRAEKAADLGLTKMLLPDDEWDPKIMARALKALPDQANPSSVHVPRLLDGLSVINSMVDLIIERRRAMAPPQLSVVSP